MSDFKELISNLLFLAKYCHEEYNELFVDNELKKAADAIEQLVRERDAAIADLTLVGSCVICKHQDYFYHGVRCGDVKCRFEWRGVREVDHENR